MSLSALRIRLLGEPMLERPGQEPQRLADKDAALLAKLALDGPQARALLCALLWPDAAADNAALSLRQRASRLSKMAGGKLVHLGATVQLDSAVEVDAAAPATLPPEALLTAGSLLAGREFGAQDELDRWLLGARESVAKNCAEALATRAEALERDGRLHEALAFARRIVELVPLGEHGARRLMRLHYLRNDRSAAQDAYWRLASALRDELGLRPSAETLQLMQTVELAEADHVLRHRPVPPSVLRPPVLVGRDPAWATMSAAWARHEPFLVVGDAGLGKTRLLDDFMRGVEGCVLERAYPGDEHAPLALLGRALVHVDRRFEPRYPDSARRELARLRPEFGPPPDAPSNAPLIRHAIEQLLVAGMAQGLHAIVLDDLHNADAATIEALRWLSACRSLSTLRWALAARPVSSARVAEPLASWLGDSRRPVRIDLQPLTRPELSALLSSLALPGLLDADIAAQLYRHAGGHPFYTLATLQDALTQGSDLRAETLPQPASVHALLDARMAHLPAGAQDLLRVAAVAGPDLRADRMARMLDRTVLELAPAWGMLEAAGVLAGEAFSHDLMHESALRFVPAGVRQALHRSFAELLTQDQSAAPSRMAHHWEQGEAWLAAARQWHAAAEVARRSGCLAEQIELFERSARCHERAGDVAGRCESLLARLEGLQLRHGGAAVLAVLPEVEALADTGLQRLRCRLARADALIDGEHAAQAAVQAAAAVEEAARHPTLLPYAHALHAQALAQDRRFDEARDAAARAQSAAAATSNSWLQLRALNAQSYVHYAEGRLADAVSWQSNAVALSEQLGHRSEVAAGTGHTAALLASIGDVPTTYAQARLAERCHRDIGLSHNSTFGIVNGIVLGTAATALGRYGEALEVLREAVAAAGPEAAPAAQVKARIALASLWLTLGRTGAARALLDELPRAVGTGMAMQALLLRGRADEQDGLSPQRCLLAIGELDRTQRDLPLVMSAHFEASYQGDAAAMCMRLAGVRSECEHKGLAGTARSIRWRELVRWLERPGDAALQAALLHARELQDDVESGLSAKCYVPQVWATLAWAYARGGDARRHALCIAAARSWIEGALSNLPAQFRDGYTRVQRVNRMVLAGEKAGAPGVL